MKYHLFGNTGLRVSELCLGTMTFGDGLDWFSGREESFKILDAFADHGGNYIDTANIYTGGQSEQIIGEFIKSNREQYVIGTKYTNAYPGAGPVNSAGNHRKNFKQSLEGSLQRLGTDYIDIYWLHIWDYLTPVDEVMRTMNDAVQEGKILYFGFSDTPAWIVTQANMLARQYGWNPISALQLEYSLLERSIERELLPMARAFDLSVNVWSPLSSGVLSGKYTRGDNKEFLRKNSGLDSHFSEERFKVARVVDAVADEIGTSSSAVALSWVRSKGTIPIIGARTAEQLQDNLKCLNCQLSNEQIETLETASGFVAGHPYNIVTNKIMTGISTGGYRDQIINHRK